MLLPNPHDPFFAPDWRWQRIEDLLSREEGPTAQDDFAVEAGWLYLSGLRRCQDDEQREELAREYPGLHAAHILHGRTDDLRRLGLEGYALGGVRAEDIDTRSGLLPGTAHHYALLYFDVAGRLGAPDYILNIVVGLHGRHLTERDAEVLVRYFGFLGGRHVVDAVIDYYTVPFLLPLVLKSVTSEDLDLFRQRLEVRLSILLECLPLSSTTLRQWLELRKLLASTERRKVPEWGGLQVALAGLLPEGADPSRAESGPCQLATDSRAA